MSSLCPLSQTVLSHLRNAISIHFRKKKKWFEANGNLSIIPTFIYRILLLGYHVKPMLNENTYSYKLKTVNTTCKDVFGHSYVVSYLEVSAFRKKKLVHFVCCLKTVCNMYCTRTFNVLRINLFLHAWIIVLVKNLWKRNKKKR